MRMLYAILCVIGAVLPLMQFLPWLAAHGFDPPLLWRSATSSPIAAFGWSDVVVSGTVVAVLIVAESRRLRMRHGWWPLCGLVIGPSLALPLFLLLRERHLAAAADGSRRPASVDASA